MEIDIDVNVKGISRLIFFWSVYTWQDGNLVPDLI